MVDNWILLHESSFGKEAVEAVAAEAVAAQKTLHAGNGKGNDFLGWLHLPSSITPAFLDEVEAVAASLQALRGGGGHRYWWQLPGCQNRGESFISDSFAHLKKSTGTRVLFAGQNIGEDSVYELQELLRGKQFGLINIPNREPRPSLAIAFRLLKKQLEDQVGKAEAKKRIVAVTDVARGALRKLADMEGYKTLSFPITWADVSRCLHQWGCCQLLWPVLISNSWWPVLPTWRKPATKRYLPSKSGLAVCSGPQRALSPRQEGRNSGELQCQTAFPCRVVETTLRRERGKSP